MILEMVRLTKIHLVKIIKYLNKSNLNIYCDWLSDNDFLKRTYASNYTKMI